MHQYNKALDIYSKLLNELLVDTLNPKYNKLLVSLYNNIGNIYDIKDTNQKALYYYQKCQVLSLKNNDSTSLSMVYKNIGDLYLKLDSLDVAEKYMKDALQIRLKLNNKAEICTNLLILSQLEKKRKNYDLALDYVQQAFDIANETGSISLQQQSLYVLAEVNELKNNIPQAYYYYKIFHNLTDSIFNERVSNEVVKLEVETIYKEQQKKLEEEQQARVKKLIFILVAFIILFIIALLLYFLAQNRIWRIKLQKQNLALEKQTLELNLETKNKELITNVMYLVKKNELLKETIKQLLEASSVASAENKKNLQNIIPHLQTSIDNDVWQDFEMQFNEVHSEFYQKLNDRYKELTPNEIKLCAFLKLNMTTKEISAITQQSARSIEVARVRLRKKLQITNTNVNLVSFLNEL
jgi:tetratricopeptide (TPR) repeat protein